MSETFQVPKQGNAIPIWIIRMFHSLHESKMNCKLEINFRDGQCVQDHTKVVLSAEKAMELCKSVKTY